jgi:toxin-antitoxin system PIN domain toxin
LTLPDVNVLIAAFRPDVPSHKICRPWLEFVVNGAAAYGMSPQVLASVLRIVTNARVFTCPDTLDNALAFCNSIVEPPHCQIIQPGPRHWSIFQDLCRNSRVSGNLVQDAWLAALAIESGCEWITLDRGFARFEPLRWREPGA